MNALKVKACIGYFLCRDGSSYEALCRVHSRGRHKVADISAPEKGPGFYPLKDCQECMYVSLYGERKHE